MGDEAVSFVLSEKFDEALAYAVSLHRLQCRKGSRVPYVGHLLSTAGLVLHYGGNEAQAIGALLHDAAEDQGGEPTLAEIRERFGNQVADIVKGCTDTFQDPKPDWRPRKEAYIASIATKSADVRLVSAADKLDNARAIVADLRQRGANLWERFSGGSHSVWYYESLVKAFADTNTGPIVDDLRAAVEEMSALKDRRG